MIINCLLTVHTENSMLRYVGEDKAGAEEYVIGRSSSRRSRRKNEKGSSPAHYTLVPALQMDMLRQDSVTTPTSDTSSIYHVSATWSCNCSRSNLHSFPLISNVLSSAFFDFILQKFD